MIIARNDGAEYTDDVDSQGFKLDFDKDVKTVAIHDKNTGETTDRNKTVFNFVGFVTNPENDLLVVFPKHYKCINPESDSRTVFDCIQKYQKNRQKTFTRTYIGEKKEDKYVSNFPFASFFGIYDYYQKYGLYFEDELFIKPNSGGKLSWKDTISKSEKFIMNDKLYFFPLFYRKKLHFSNFVTECMIYAIDYTVSRFGFLIDAQDTGEDLPEFDYLQEKEYVVSVLQRLKQQVFRDNVQNLIEDLIDFYSDTDIGGSYYFKYYSFSSIWEDMIEGYLCRYFKAVGSDHSVIFDKASPSGLKFKKESFHTNSAKPSQYISPDHYCEDSNVQMIFDAKYFTEVYGMNYKQIAYMFMLKDQKDMTTGTPKFSSTHSALILPSHKRETRMHFQLAPQYGSSNNLVITEEYLDIREVIDDYLNSTH